MQISKLVYSVKVISRRNHLCALQRIRKGLSLINVSHNRIVLERILWYHECILRTISRLVIIVHANIKHLLEYGKL